MGCSRIVSVSFLLISLTVMDVVVGRRIAAPPPCKFPAIYNFGDSNSDTGGISAAFGPVPPPYGSSFFGHPAGRESDGRLIIDFIAEHLGLPYLSSYLDSIGSGFRRGANFAAGGSTVVRLNESMLNNGISPFSLDVQIVQFDQFKSRTNALYRHAVNPYYKSKLPRLQEFSRALYTFDIGQNDLIDGFRKLTRAQLRASFPLIVNQLATAVTHLYKQGARTFWIHNVGPVGCLPASTFHVRNSEPGFLDKHGCIKYQNKMAVEFNKQLKARVAKLRVDLPCASLIYVDIYSARYHLISNTRFYGFMDPLKICCGHHESNIHVWCGQAALINGSQIIGASCGSPDSYVSWDGVHYSEAANHWTANHILNGSFSDPSTPIVRACLKR